MPSSCRTLARVSGEKRYFSVSIPFFIISAFSLSPPNSHFAAGTEQAIACQEDVLARSESILSDLGLAYRIVDLCAGEKERGTLETLLSSPAERSASSASR